MTQGKFKIVSARMRGVDAVSADTSHTFGRHTHDQFGIGVILRGAQKSMSARGIVEAEAGDVITVKPGRCTMAHRWGRAAGPGRCFISTRLPWLALSAT